jgi:hypothetical protein
MDSLWFVWKELKIYTDLDVAGAVSNLWHPVLSFVRLSVRCISPCVSMELRLAGRIMGLMVYI